MVTGWSADLLSALSKANDQGGESSALVTIQARLWGRPPVCRSSGPPARSRVAEEDGAGGSVNRQAGGLPHG